MLSAATMGRWKLLHNQHYIFSAEKSQLVSHRSRANLQLVPRPC